MMRGAFKGCFIVFLLLLASCQPNDKIKQDPEGIYLDYQVHAKEGDDNLTVLLQFRRDDVEEEAMVTLNPGEVRVDGELINPDSTGAGDIFYEVHKSIEGFAGTHQVILKDSTGEVFQEEFSFQPFRLTTLLPDTVRRADLDFAFENIEKGAFIRILMTDTSFINDGVNRLDRAANGELTLPVTALERLANGPIHLEFTREYQRPVMKNPGGGGRLLITYSISREFFLAD